jgi:hypothetical protein
MNRRGKLSKCIFGLILPIIDGIADTSAPTCFGKHSRNCCSKSGVDPNSYNWEGKEFTKSQPNEELPKEVKIKIVEKKNCNLNIMVPAKKSKQCIDMRKRQDLLLWQPAISPLSPKPFTMSAGLKWTGVTHQAGLDWSLVQNTRRACNLGDLISTVENTPEYSKMSDSALPFLQVSMNLANPKIGEEQIRIMILGNPALIGTLKNPGLDVFVHATFNCVPKPFLQ